MASTNVDTSNLDKLVNQQANGQGTTPPGKPSGAKGRGSGKPQTPKDEGKTKAKRDKTVSVCMTAEMQTKLEALAAAKHKSKSDVLCAAFEYYLTHTKLSTREQAMYEAYMMQP